MSTPLRPGDVTSPAPPVGLSPQESSTSAAQAPRVQDGGQGTQGEQGHVSPLAGPESHVSPFTLDPSTVSSPVTPLSDYHRPSPAQSANMPPQASRVLFTPGPGHSTALEAIQDLQRAEETAGAGGGAPSHETSGYSPTHFSSTFDSSACDERTDSGSVNFSGGAQSDAGTLSQNPHVVLQNTPGTDFTFKGPLSTPQVEGAGASAECPPAPSKHPPH